MLAKLKRVFTLQSRRRSLQTKSKAETFIGFIIRAKKCKVGGNAVNTLKKAHLIIVCKSASENTFSLAKKYGKRFKCPVLKTEGKLLEELTFIANGKIMAVTDFALAKAVMENMEKDLTIINGEENG